jgi:hypothetical protein
MMFFLVDSGSFGGRNQALDNQYLTNNNNTNLVLQLIFSSSSTEKLSWLYPLFEKKTEKLT